MSTLVKISDKFGNDAGTITFIDTYNWWQKFINDKAFEYFRDCHNDKVRRQAHWEDHLFDEYGFRLINHQCYDASFGYSESVINNGGAIVFTDGDKAIEFILKYTE